MEHHGQGAIDPVCGMTVDPATAKHKADSLKATAEAAKQTAGDSLKVKAAVVEKSVKDSLKVLLGKKTPPKPAPEVVAPKATVVEAKPEPTPKADSKGCSLTKMVFAAKVENREASGEAQEFAAGQVACWSRIACGSEAMTIHYVWSKDGKQVHDIPISMKHSGRGWSRATVTAGKWKVTLLKDGAEIGSGEMTVK